MTAVQGLSYLEILVYLAMAIYSLSVLKRKAMRIIGNTTLHATSFPARELIAGKKTDDPSNTRVQTKELRFYKGLYFKLQNLEDQPKVLPQAYALLKFLLGQSLLAEQSDSSPKSILTIQSYSKEALQTFILDAHNSVLREYERYELRIESGASPELFTNRKEAERWLLKHAPVKLIDGAWLGRVHSVSTPFAFRGVTSEAFQILSEELGDGDTEKNHVHVYRELLESAGLNLPAGDTFEFIQDRIGMDELQPWKAAVGQLVISLFPCDFLAEALGFNLRFEMLTLETLQTARELPMYGLSALYPLLHVTVDNADSGHAAMALNIVVRYLDIVQDTEGRAVMQQAWRRVQAGYILSEHLALDSRSGEVWPTELEAELIRILKGKASVSDELHCRSREKIGKETLRDWLSPTGWTDKQEQQSRLRSLADAVPWVIRAHPEKSLLLRELSWKGKMYGAFTTAEVELLRQWILSLGSARPTYEQLVGPIPETDLSRYQHLLEQSPTNAGGLSEVSSKPIIFEPQAPIMVTNAALAVVLSLWFVHPCVLEHALSAPHTSSNKLWANILLLTKAEQGLEPGPGSSLFQLGMDMVRRHKFPAPSCLQDIVEENTAEITDCLLSWSMRPGRHIGFLLGLSRAFLDFEVWVANERFLDVSGKATLLLLVDTKQGIFRDCIRELDSGALAEFISGYEFGRLKIGDTLICHHRTPSTSSGRVL